MKVYSGETEKYEAEPIVFETNNKKEITTVNGQPYDGTGTFDFVVTQLGGSEEKGAITGFIAFDSALESTGGLVQFWAAGTNLSAERLNIQIEENGQTIELPVSNTNDTATRQEFTVLFPENKTTSDKTYTVKVAADKDSTSFQSKTVTVAASKDIPVDPDPDPDPDPDDTEGSVNSISVSPKEVSCEGGSVNLTVTGEDLTASNWGVTVKAYIANTDIERDLKAEISDITASGATIKIPANTMVNQIEYRITAGAKKDGTVTEQAQTSITQEGKPSTVQVFPESVKMADASTVVVTFREAVDFAKDLDKLKELIFVANGNNENENRYDLGAEDTITLSEDKTQVTLHYSRELNLTALSQIYMKEGSLKNADGTILKEIKWSITSKPTISDISLEKEIFDYKGGTATAHLTGLRADEISLDTITASVFMAEGTSATDIPVSIAAGTEGPVLTFDVPENTTGQTQSYILKVNVDGLPVYEGAGTNAAEKAVVSVLPKGETDTTLQTLGGMTITGHNKVDSEGDVKNITVQVLSGTEGGLKVLLRLYGTNLDASKTTVRAIDENGIIWPVYSHVPGCDGEWRFLATAGMNANGVIGDGNSQLIEVLPPKYAGTNKTYKLQVALDGEHFIEEPYVTLTVNNENLKDSEDYVECSPENYKYVTVKYIDEETGEEIADPQVFTGYFLTAVKQFVPEFAPKDIEGYTLVKEPVFPENVDWDWYFIEEGKEYTYVYHADEDKKPEIKLDSIQVTAPQKTNYTAGEELDLTGMKVVAKYTDGTEKEITKGYEVSGYNKDKIGSQTITVTYEDKSGTFEVTVKEETKPLPYTDVEQGTWYYDAVEYNYLVGTMTGKNTTSFAPYETLVRAQFTTILHRMEGTPDTAYTSRFPDVQDGQWYTTSILWAAQANVVTGYTDSGYFGTNDPITREQMVVMMYRYANYKGYDTSKTSEINRFTDAGRVSEFAEEAMKWAVANEIISGKENGDGSYRLDPQGSTSRAECAIIIMRFLEKF